jgi:Family of unknown function (DUF6011)
MLTATATLPMTRPVPKSATRPDDAGNLTVGQFDLTKHNGFITIHNPSTGNHRTFHIETVMGDDALAGKRIVRLLTGLDRDDPSHWRGFAFADEFGVHVWKRFRGTGKPSDYERFARMLSETQRYADRGIRYMISGTCRRCNRVLTNPASIDSGIGPVCAEKSGH